MLDLPLHPIPSQAEMSCSSSPPRMKWGPATLRHCSDCRAVMYAKSRLAGSLDDELGCESMSFFSAQWGRVRM